MTCRGPFPTPSMDTCQGHGSRTAPAPAGIVADNDIAAAMSGTLIRTAP